MSVSSAPGQERQAAEGPASFESAGNRPAWAARLESICAELDVASGNAERVSVECRSLREDLQEQAYPLLQPALLRLLPYLAASVRRAVEPVFSLLEDAARCSSDPWPLLKGMLSARDPALVRRAVDLVAEMACDGSFLPGLPAAGFFAGRVRDEDPPFDEPALLERIAAILRCLPRTAAIGDPFLGLYLAPGDVSLRLLAARLLDRTGLPAPAELADALLGPVAHSILRPYLEYTRASYMDLLYLALGSAAQPEAFGWIVRAESVCGPALLREVLAEFGWRRTNLGLQVETFVAVSSGDSLPFLVHPLEAPFLQGDTPIQCGPEIQLFVAHGGLPSDRAPGDGASDTVARFRRYNLAHAEALTDILDLAPLTRDRVERILERMDRIVDDFACLFAFASEECAILLSVYRQLRDRITSEMERSASRPQLSPELTRLVQMFEDPASVGRVQTLHGLKRYLHQRGLQLGMRLVESGRATNRTVDLIVAARKRPLGAVRVIQYTDFESTSDQAGPPYAVRMLAEAYAFQMLHGHSQFPKANVFCYGNEIHYYIAFANHPVFLRVDLSPPLQGGMIDLQYYGVSKYEMSQHPNPSLDVIRRFFERLDFDVQVDATRIHARFDKERAPDLETLCDKTEYLFRLAPYLMDLDWIVGGLALDAAARLKIGDAWADLFQRWGTLPFSRLLSLDRTGALVAVEEGPAGEREILWSGAGPYPDGFSRPSLRWAGSAALDLEPPLSDADCAPAGQYQLERRLLRPLREALLRGELMESDGRLVRSPPEHFEREHEAVVFAHLLRSADADLAAATRVAYVVTRLERALHFRTSGTINGYEVQRARLGLPEEPLCLCVLRDGVGMIRLAFFARGESPYRRRDPGSGAWISNRSSDAEDLAARLWRANFTLSGGPPGPVSTGDPTNLRLLFSSTADRARQEPIAGERVVAGLPASPGRATGIALFDTARRLPEHFDGAVLVAESVRPQDNSFIFHASAVVSTGGGVLSHAGLIATQFRKPALLVFGRWTTDAHGSKSLWLRTTEFRAEDCEISGLNVRLFRSLEEREHRIQEGDLIVVDADEATLHVLGQERDAITLHEALQSLRQTGELLERVNGDRELLAVRGQHLRARHQMEKLFARSDDAVLARYAVREMLLGDVPGSARDGGAERAALLRPLVDHPRLGAAVRRQVQALVEELARRSQAACTRAKSRVPAAQSLYEVLAERLDALRLSGSIASTESCLARCGISSRPPSETDDLDSVVRQRLDSMKKRLQAVLRRTSGRKTEHVRTRYRVRELERVGELLGGLAPDEGEQLTLAKARMDGLDRRNRRAHECQRILHPREGGFELYPLIGWKAAHLSEVRRTLGPASVPPWFVVTHTAFEEVMQLPAGGSATLREAIDSILARVDLDDGRKSALIGALWAGVMLPDNHAAEAVAAYRKFSGDTPIGGSGQDAYVAIRSSALEEDTEIAARAGEFETFLYVRGEEALLRHLKRAWSGLWTERAIHNRAILGSTRIGGGVIVQRIVPSRVSGVLQTVNVAEREPREMVINAGLGLGEGVVSGIVAADQVRVAREGDLLRGPLRFNYVVRDKLEQVVFNKLTGLGTARVQSLYHQRLRPALEYVEIQELVSMAYRLEAAFGCPLDIEFGIEGSRIWILQARPVPAFHIAMRETIDRYPLRQAELHRGGRE